MSKDGTPIDLTVSIPAVLQQRTVDAVTAERELLASWQALNIAKQQHANALAEFAAHNSAHIPATLNATVSDAETYRIRSVVTRKLTVHNKDAIKQWCGDSPFYDEFISEKTVVSASLRAWDSLPPATQQWLLDAGLVSFELSAPAVKIELKTSEV